MKVILDPKDLKPEFQLRDGTKIDQGIPTSEVTFEMLTEKATFNAWYYKTYKVISASK